MTDLRPALEDAIRTLRASNPLLPVKVVVPNHLLGVWLSRSIFKDTGHMAIEFVLAHELAWKVAAPSLLREGRTRVPENVGLAVLLGAIPEAVAHQGTPEYLREAVKTAGFAPAALRTIEDLAGANLRPEHLETAAPTAADPERLRLVARLWRAFEAGLEKARLLDRASLYGAATSALPSDQVGAVVLCGSDDPSPAAGAFLEALGTHHPFALLAEAPIASVPRHASRQQGLAARLPKTLSAGSHQAPSKERTDALARLKTRLFASAPPAATTAPTESEAALDPSLHILSAAGEALGRPHPEDPTQALDRIERDLALVSSGQPGVARHLASPDSFLVRSLQQERAGWDASLTPWDGIVDVAGAGEASARLRLAGQRSSASVVETFAGCPYRHFLRTGLRLRAWEEPERAYQAEPKDFGSLYHSVAHRLFAELQEQHKLPLAPDAPDQLAERIGALVDEELARFAAEGGIVNAALLDPIRVRLRSDIEEMLRDEIESPADGFVPEAFEQEFEAVEVPLGQSGSVSFRGKIDRIDVAQGARRVRVIDYKTGGHYWKRGEEWKGGRELQLALYNHAARQIFPEHEVAEAVYYYATAKGEYKRKGRHATPEVNETLTTVLTTLDDLAAAGVFPPVADTCMFCDFQSVCGPFREPRAARKSADPRLAAFKRLRVIQ